MTDYKWLRKDQDAPGGGVAYRNVDFAKPPVLAEDGPITTLYELFASAASKHADRPCLGSRPISESKGGAGAYVFETYAEVKCHVDALGSALTATGVGAGDRVGIYGANSPFWMKTMQACNRQSCWCIPLYDTLGENAIEYIVTHAECSIVFASDAKLPTLLNSLPKLPRIKTVVVWGPRSTELVKNVPTAVKAMTFDDFMQLGMSNPAPAIPPKPTDLSTIMYTSGTTGEPKGVMLTHAAVIATIASSNAFMRMQLGVDVADPADLVFLSYLSLCHIFDRVMEELIISLGGCIGYWQGDIASLMDDIAALRPTVLIGVPRVFERIHSGVMDKLAGSGCVKQMLFHWGFNTKLKHLQDGRPYDKAAPLFDAVLFKKIAARLGGRIKLIISGGAPLAKHVEQFLRVTMCAAVVQGYGLTETCAASFIALPEEYGMLGTVGAPQPVIAFKLEAVEDMGYLPTANPPRGEVCIRGPSVFSGYYKQQDKTAEVLDVNGWFHTGDIGTITALGSLQIIDRKKNIFKLSQGEYVAVEKLEETYKKASMVEQIWVYGNSFESCLVAVVVPKAAAVQAWAKDHCKDGDVAALCLLPEASTWVLDELTRVGKADKLKGFEIVKAVLLEPSMWMPGVELTPTFKLKRSDLLKKYQTRIDAAYRAIKKA